MTGDAQESQQRGTTAAGLLVLPGWDDKGKHQFDALHAELRAHDWACWRAALPDADWSPTQRRRVTRADSLKQAIADCSILRGQIAETGRVAFLGFSYGGYMAALVTETESADWLVLRSPALYPDENWSVPKEQLDEAVLAQYRGKVHGPQDNRALRCCSEFRGDVLLINSQFDDIIPRQVIESYSKSFVSARSVTKETLQGADHVLSQPQWQQQYHRLVVEWLLARQRETGGLRPQGSAR